MSCRKNKKSSNVSVIIADDKTITDPAEIAEKFNKLFTSIGTNLQKKVSSSKKTFTDYLKKRISENVIITPTMSDEIQYTILYPAKAFIFIVSRKNLKS